MADASLALTAGVSPSSVSRPWRFILRRHSYTNSLIASDDVRASVPGRPCGRAATSGASIFGLSWPPKLSSVVFCRPPTTLDWQTTTVYMRLSDYSHNIGGPKICWWLCRLSRRREAVCSLLTLDQDHPYIVSRWRTVFLQWGWVQEPLDNRKIGQNFCSFWLSLGGTVFTDDGEIWHCIEGQLTRAKFGPDQGRGGHRSPNLWKFGNYCGSRQIFGDFVQNERRRYIHRSCWNLARKRTSYTPILGWV